MLEGVLKETYSSFLQELLMLIMGVTDFFPLTAQHFLGAESLCGPASCSASPAWLESIPLYEIVLSLPLGSDNL